MIIVVAYLNATYAVAKIMAEKKKSSDLKAILCMFPLKALFLQLLLLLDVSITTWKIFHVVEKWFIERN